MGFIPFTRETRLFFQKATYGTYDLDLGGDVPLVRLLKLVVCCWQKVGQCPNLRLTRASTRVLLCLSSVGFAISKPVTKGRMSF